MNRRISRREADADWCRSGRRRGGRAGGTCALSAQGAVSDAAACERPPLSVAAFVESRAAAARPERVRLHAGRRSRYERSRRLECAAHCRPRLHARDRRAAGADSRRRTSSRARSRLAAASRSDGLSIRIITAITSREPVLHRRRDQQPPVLPQRGAEGGCKHAKDVDGDAQRRAGRRAARAGPADGHVQGRS